LNLAVSYGLIAHPAMMHVEFEFASASSHSIRHSINEMADLVNCDSPLE
jgi:hypothetical protein